MATHPNVALIARGFDAFNAADTAALTELMSENSVQHMAGRNPVFSRVYTCRDAIFAVYARGIGQRRHGAAYRAKAEREGKALDMSNALVFRIENGIVTELTVIAHDVDGQDAFWS